MKTKEDLREERRLAERAKAIKATADNIAKGPPRFQKRRRTMTRPKLNLRPKTDTAAVTEQEHGPGLVQSTIDWLDQSIVKLTTTAAKEGQKPDGKIMQTLKYILSLLARGVKWAIEAAVSIKNWIVAKWGELQMWDRVSGGCRALVEGFSKALDKFFHPNEVKTTAKVA